MRILLTGASGFIGRHVHQLLLARDVEVVAVARSRPQGAVGHWLEADLLAPGVPEQIIAEVRPTHLIHLAWNAKPGEFWHASDNLDWMSASLKLVTSFWEGGGGKAVVAGSCAEYGWDREILIESSPCAPATLYGASKDALRRLLETISSHDKRQLAWGRVFWLYGPGEPRGRLISDVAVALVEGRPVDCGPGLEARDFLHVTDVARAFVALTLENIEGLVNISSGAAVEIKKILNSLEGITSKSGLIRLGTRHQPIGTPRVLIGENSRLRNELCFQPVFSLEKGLAETLDWWRAELARDATVAR